MVPASGIDKYFETLVYSCDVGVCKPDARIYQHALQDLGVTPAESVMVGDSRKSDFQGAADCGINSVLLDRRAAANGTAAIRTLTELPRVIEALNIASD